jgi:hypothetical protein
VVYRYTETGEQVRVSKRTGQVVPVPPENEATVDYSKKSAYKRKHITLPFKFYLQTLKLFFFVNKAADKDTRPEDLKVKTFVTKYKTFEEDLADEYNLEKQPPRAQTYIY